MAFAQSGLNRISSGANTVAPTLFAYITSADTFAQVKASAYFNNAMQDLTNGIGTFKVADNILVQASDNAGLIRVTAVTTNVTTEDLIGPGDVAPDDIALTNTYIMVGASTGRAAGVAMSGDATIANTGALTIADSVLEGSNVANVADANVIGGIPVVHRITTAGGATANTDVTLTHKTRVLDVWIINRAAGTASDTVQVLNSTNAITDAVDISGADNTIARASTIDDAYEEIAAAGTLRVTETDGGGSDSPSVDVYVLGLRVA